MSLVLTKAVYELPAEETTGEQQSILLALADCANEHKGFACFPSRETLVKKTHFCEKTVQRAITALKAKGFIRVIPRKLENGGHSSNSYEFLEPIMARVSQSPSLGLTDPRVGSESSHPLRSHRPTNKNNEQEANFDCSERHKAERANRMSRYFTSIGYPADYDPENPDKYPDLFPRMMDWTWEPS